MAAPSTQPIGLALPAIRTQGGYFASRDAYDTAFGDVVLTIMCPIGGRWGNRQFGSASSSYLFDPADSALVSLLKEAISTAISTWCPHVNLLDTKVNVNGVTVQLFITFSLATDRTTPVTKLLTVSRRSAIQFLSVPR